MGVAVVVAAGVEADGNRVVVASLIVGRFVVAAIADSDIFAACLYGQIADAMLSLVDVRYMVGSTVVADGVAIDRGSCGLTYVGVGSGMYFFACIFTHSNIVFRVNKKRAATHI